MAVSRYLLTNGTVVSPGLRERSIKQSNVLIEGDRIAAIGPNVTAHDCEVMDLAGALISPGFVDTHRHVWQANIRGICADWTLAHYLRGIRLHLAKFYSPQDVYASVLLGAVEALKCGVTSMVDFSHIMNSPEHAAAALDALEDSGIRAIFAYGFNEVPLPNPVFTSHRERMAEARRLAKRLAGGNSLVRMGLALSEPDYADYALVRDELLLAKELALPTTMHIAFDRQVAGNTVLSNLNRDGLLPAECVYVHGNWLGDNELRIISDTGGFLSVTPETEMQMGMGFPATNNALAAGLHPTLGIDIVSNQSGDMFSQMRLALQTARAIDNARTLELCPKFPEEVSLTCADALRMATRNGAAAMGTPSLTGEVQQGAVADLIVCRVDRLGLVPMSDPLGSLVLQCNAADVSAVFVAGKPVVMHHRMCRLDEQAVISAAIASWEGLMERAKTTLPDSGAGWSDLYSQ